MIKRLCVVMVILSSALGWSQSRTASPYSFFGLGQQTFQGTIENRSMSGMGTYADSIHINLRNPASYGKLRLTTYAVGLVHTETWADTNSEDETYDATSIEYVSIGIPLGSNFGVNFGLVPFQSVGYQIGSNDPDTYSNFTGEGSINRTFLGLGYQFNENFSIGAEARYNFGQETNSSSIAITGVQLGTNELNETDLSGLSFNLGLHYQRRLGDAHELQLSAVYSPESTITAQNTRILSTFLRTGIDTEATVNIGVPQEAEQELKLPSQLTLGATIGIPRLWNLGMEYSHKGNSATGVRSFSPNNSAFTDATTLRAGGFYIPNYNSVTSYWDRVVYRGGLRYEQTGLRLDGQDIDEFGISFGIGLPVGRRGSFSNANIGLELGQRGTTDNNLIRERFVGLSVGLSLNDKWFQKRKYN